jgi:hypothetical protein
MDHLSTNRRKPPKPVKPVKPTNLKASVVTESAQNPGPTVDASAGPSLDWDKYFEGQEVPKVILNPVKDQVLESGSSPPTPMLSKNPWRASPPIVPATISHVAESLQAIPVPTPSPVQSELDEVEKESRELVARLQLLNSRKKRLEEERQEQEKIERERAALARARAEAERKEAERKELERQELERQEAERQMLQRLKLEKQRQEEEERLRAEQLRLRREKLIQQRMELQKQEQLLREMEQTLQRDRQEDESLAKETQKHHMNLQKPASDHPVEPPKEETAGKVEQQKVVENEVTENNKSMPTVNRNLSFDRRRDESEQSGVVDAERPPRKRQESYESDRKHLSPSLKSPASQPQSPSNSSMHSRQPSSGSVGASSLSTHTDEDLAWELAAEVDIQDVKLTDLHPILQQQMQEALNRHMPPEYSVPKTAPSGIAALEDTEEQPPPVPPKESFPGRHPPVRRPLPEDEKEEEEEEEEEEVPTGETLASDSGSNRKISWNFVRPPNSGPSKERPPTPRSGPFKDFDSDTGADTIDEDRCFCGKARPSVEECYFCWPCDGTIFCKECWDNCPPHKKRRMRAAGAGLPHEKTNPAVARKIFYTLQSDHDTKEQALQHVKDEDTSWFGAGRDEQDDVVFQDFGRYARLMAEKSARHRRVRYPALVSFVGQTGAGKSSLIRLLIELYAPAGSKSQVPVVGSNLHQDVPTSGDVHLYADPTTFEGDLPILYADCEGLDGGEREPMGARTRNKRDVSDKRTNSFIKQIRKQHHTSEREIVWATTPKTRSREYHVRNLYPRLLYTFSDVIVFVTKNPRVIENVIEQLIRWAAAALETSSNQPLLPHAIIVFNASDNATDPILWDVNHATISLMDSVRRAVHQNHNMRKFAEFWRQKGKPVESVEMLLLSYYSSIRVVRVVSIRSV